MHVSGDSVPADGEVKADGRRPHPVRARQYRRHRVGVAQAVRHLETFGRKDPLYLEVDRAGISPCGCSRKWSGEHQGSATALNLDASTVTRQVSGLEGVSFVERRPDPLDGRSSTIVLTEEGYRTMIGVERERRQVMEALVSDWTVHDKLTLGRALTRLNISLLESGRTAKDVD